MGKTNKQLSALVATLVFALIGCQEKSSDNKDAADSPSATPTPAPESPKEPPAACIHGGDSPIIKEHFKSLLESVCSAEIWNDINDEKNIYRNVAGDPYVLTTGNAKKVDNNTEARSAGIMLAPTSAANYAAMLRMRVSFPQEFKQTGFDTDPTLKITAQEVSAEWVRYDYYLTGTDVDTEYTARAEFIQIEPSGTIIVATRALASFPMKTVRTYHALIIVEPTGESSSRVIGISLANIDNSGNHTEALKSINKRFAKDSKIALGNVPQALKANEFLKSRD